MDNTELQFGNVEEAIFRRYKFRFCEVNMHGSQYHVIFMYTVILKTVNNTE